MAPKVENLGGSFGLGEGPHWDEEKQCLFFVDCINNSLHKFDPATKEVTGTSPIAPGEKFIISIIIPVKNESDKFVITSENEFHLIQWNGKDKEFKKLQVLGKTDEPLHESGAGFRFNDGKCDSKGRLWAGTLVAKFDGDIVDYPKVGSLFSITKNQQLVKHHSGIGIANGLAWNDKTKAFFYIDSVTMDIQKFDYDPETGSIKNNRTWFTLKQHGVEGLADGMAIDNDGNIWVALFNGSSVIQIDGSKPESLLSTVKLPAKQITSVAWGGKNLDELYVTSAAFGDPSLFTKGIDGALYRISGTGTKGPLGPKYVIS